MMKMSGFDVFASVLIILGALNWGLIGLFGMNIVGMIFGYGSVIERSIYVIIGLAGLWEAFSLTTKSPAMNAYQHKGA